MTGRETLRHCTACVHFKYTEGEHGYYVGETQMSAFECARAVWQIDSTGDDQVSLWRKLNSAQDCERFELAPYAALASEGERGR